MHWPLAVSTDGGRRCRAVTAVRLTERPLLPRDGGAPRGMAGRRHHPGLTTDCKPSRHVLPYSLKLWPVAQPKCQTLGTRRRRRRRTNHGDQFQQALGVRRRAHLVLGDVCPRHRHFCPRRREEHEVSGVEHDRSLGLVVARLGVGGGGCGGRPGGRSGAVHRSAVSTLFAEKQTGVTVAHCCSAQDATFVSTTKAGDTPTPKRKCTNVELC
mmetsp:Transcript_48174/g.145542  ORF Transcript_48174/g.145542 Transcript_48174/m.145542 type:complete len:212 (-) Transcript_48174:68-703(-)